MSTITAPKKSSLDHALPGILVVDDNPNNLLAIETALDGLGARVVRAQSGVDALRQLLLRDFSLVLLDVQMPSLDGFETARMIRERERNRETPIIFVTAYGSGDQEVLRAYAMGAVDFLFKPIVPEILEAKASVLLALQRRTREVQVQAGLLREQERQLHQQELAEQRRSLEQEALRQQMQEQARVAQEMERHAEELRRTIKEREEAERKLTLSNEQLAESDRRKDEFLAVLAHELRNPLAPIVASLGLFEALLKGRDDLQLPQLARAQAAMQRQVQHLIRLVDDLLDISRINSGKIELRREVTDLNAVVQHALSTSEALLQNNQHQLECNLSEEPILLSGDVVRLTQVVANLLNNAARYTPPGGRIHVQTLSEGDEAVMRVRDSGQGIPDHLLDSIFDTFFQSRPNGEGLGLGLTLVKRLVELHGGTVAAKSFGTGQGSEFEIRLPLRLGTAEDIPAAAPPEASSLPNGGLTIAIVDDNPDVRETVSLLLDSYGYAVHSAASGLEGVELILSVRPDAALVDIGLEDVDGYTVAERIRAALGSDAPHLIAMTGFGRQKDRARAAQAGFAAHLVKPATAETILAALREVPRRTQEVRKGQLDDSANREVGGEVDAAN